MTYDSSIERVVLFSGFTLSEVESDMWSYDANANMWEQIEPVGEVPAQRQAHSMVCAPSMSGCLLFGGSGRKGELYGDTWAYESTGGRWTRLHPAGDRPPSLSGAAMVFVPTTGEVVLFGGIGAAGASDDTWIYEPPKRR